MSALITRLRASKPDEPNIRNLPFNIDKNSHTEALIEVADASCGRAVRVAAILNDSPENGPHCVGLTIFSDGLSEPREAFNLYNIGLAANVEIPVIEGIGRALLTLAEALRRAGIDREGAPETGRSRQERGES